MDTWATSSLTPQIVTGWIENPDLFERTFPMDLRPQGHDIIRTWLFSTIVRGHHEHGSAPWSNAAISGWILDPDRKKMSKSKGNVVTPMGLLEEHGSDAVRYWAARGRPGTDTAFDPGQMKVGRRLAIKILNASRFALGLGHAAAPAGPDAIAAPLDLAMIAQLAGLVRESTEAFDDYDYARVLERTEAFFWGFTDDYLELVKNRSYGAHGDASAASAQASLRLALETLLQLFAPFLPFVTEEVWSWWREGSVHRSSWPDTDSLEAVAAGGDANLLVVAGEVLSELRRVKSEAKRRLSTDITEATVADTAERIALLERVRIDVCDAGRVQHLTTEPADELAVTATLAPED